VEEDKTHDVYAALVQTGDPVPALGVGTNVCVRNRFVGDWVTGFRVAEVLGDGYRIRRFSDDHVFPDLFAFDDVRLERRQQPLRGITGSYLDRRH